MDANIGKGSPMACDTAFFQALNHRTYPTPDTSRSATLWISLRGTFAIETRDGPFVLARRQYLTLPHDYRPNLLPGEDFLGLLVAFPQRLATVLACSKRSPVAHHEVFALRSNASATLLRIAINLLRLDGQGEAEQSAFQMHRLLIQARAGQPEISTWLDRAPGRTRAHRRIALQRLLHARNMILNSPFEENKLEDLASAARYSKSHFVKAFRDVFGETPGALHRGARIAMAQLLMVQSSVSRSGLSIGEIAADVGYGSRCAFSRMFKSRVGVNASSFLKQSASQQPVMASADE